MKIPLIAFALFVGVAGAAQEDREYELLIVNQTEAQTLTLPLAITHSAGFAVFHEKEMASSALVELAEQGRFLPLEKKINSSGANASVTRGTSPIRPGKTMLIRLYPETGQDRVSLLAKLLTTNDAFLGIDGEALPASGSREIIAPVFSSGTQLPNELCAFIPGPPCNQPGQSSPRSAPIAIFPQSGLRGIGDLDAKNFGWSKGVALVRLTRVH